MQSHSFQATKFNLHRIVNDSQGQVVERFTILFYLREVRNKELITPKTCLIAFAQFLSYEVQTSLDRQRIPGTGRGGFHDSTTPQRGQK